MRVNAAVSMVLTAFIGFGCVPETPPETPPSGSDAGAEIVRSPSAPDDTTPAAPAGENAVDGAATAHDLAAAIRAGAERRPTVALIAEVADARSVPRRWIEDGRHRMAMGHTLTLQIERVSWGAGPTEARFDIDYVRSAHHWHVDRGDTYLFLLTDAGDGLAPVYVGGLGALHLGGLIRHGIDPAALVALIFAEGDGEVAWPAPD